MTNPGHSGISAIVLQGTAVVFSATLDLWTNRQRQNPGASSTVQLDNRTAEPYELSKLEAAVDNALSDEIDQCVGLGVDVILVEKHFSVLENFAKTPGERLHIVHQSFVRAKCVEPETFRRVRRKVGDVAATEFLRSQKARKPA